MLDSFLTLVSFFWDILKYPLYLIGIFVAFFCFCIFVHYLYLAIVKKVPKLKGEHYRIKQPNLIKRIFWLAPKRYAEDIRTRNPEMFKYQGIIVFCGQQGMGKTVSMIEQAMRMQQEYPKAKCLANLSYKYADDKLETWDDLINYQNPHGKHCGVIVINDELQNTFNSKQSKDFPMEYVGIVTQNRKNRRVLLATAQNFYMLSKDIRSQCTEIRQCYTILGCITFVHCMRPDINNNGEVEKLKHIRWYMYVHSQELRDSYDTYEVIKKMQKAGFRPRSEQASAFSDLQIKLEENKKK